MCSFRNEKKRRTRRLCYCSCLNLHSLIIQLAHSTLTTLSFTSLNRIAGQSTRLGTSTWLTMKRIICPRLWYHSFQSEPHQTILSKHFAGLFLKSWIFQGNTSEIIDGVHDSCFTQSDDEERGKKNKKITRNLSSSTSLTSRLPAKLQHQAVRHEEKSKCQLTKPEALPQKCEIRQRLVQRSFFSQLQEKQAHSRDPRAHVENGSKHFKWPLNNSLVVKSMTWGRCTPQRWEDSSEKWNHVGSDDSRAEMMNACATLGPWPEIRRLCYSPHALRFVCISELGKLKAGLW